MIPRKSDTFTNEKPNKNASHINMLYTNDSKAAHIVRIHKAWSEHGVEAFKDGAKEYFKYFFCPVLKCLDSMLAPGFMNSVYRPVNISLHV